MKTFVILAILAVAVSSLPIDIEEAGSDSDLNGWYVPQYDGSFEWMSVEEAEAALKQHDVKINGRADDDLVKYWLYTRQNPTVPVQIFDAIESIEASAFNPKVPTKILTHGWLGDHNSEFIIEIAETSLDIKDINVIVVEWKNGKSYNYISAVAFVSKVALKVASFIDFLNQDIGMPLDTLQCISNSLGCHLCGYIGKYMTGKMHKIVALDPALPLFDYNKPELRLNSEDATYVESIQTSGPILGFIKPIGSSTFYPNGGKSQPGCGLDAAGSCSHGRAIAYYTAAIKLNNFPSIKCNNYNDAINKKCGSTYSAYRMASDTDTDSITLAGQYYVPVSAEYPYGGT